MVAPDAQEEVVEAHGKDTCGARSAQPGCGPATKVANGQLEVVSHFEI